MLQLCMHAHGHGTWISIELHRLQADMPWTHRPCAAFGVSSCNKQLGANCALILAIDRLSMIKLLHVHAQAGHTSADTADSTGRSAPLSTSICGF